MKASSKLNVWTFFAAVYLVSAAFYVPILLSNQGINTPLNKALMALTTFVPSAMGVLFVRLTRTPAERKDFWRRVTRWPGGQTKMAVVGMVSLPLITITSFLAASLIDGIPIQLSYALKMLTDWKTLLVFLVTELTFGAISEELGWRGYALDELQSRWNALTSSLILGLVWAFWHTPAFLIPGLSQYEMGGIFSWTYVFFIASVAIGAILHTWIYNQTGRNILVAGILMHFTQNATMIFLAGIFDGYSMPPAFWPMQFVTTALVAAWVAMRWRD